MVAYDFLKLCMLYSRWKAWYQLGRRMDSPQSWFGHCGKDKDLLPLLRIKPKFLNFLAHSLVTIQLSYPNLRFVCIIEGYCFEGGFHSSPIMHILANQVCKCVVEISDLISQSTSTKIVLVKEMRNKIATWKLGQMYVISVF